MIILRDVLAELIGMFVGDARLSAAVLAVVAFAALLIEVGHVLPLIGGGVLMAGCLAILIGAVRRDSLRAVASAAARYPDAC